MNKNAELGTLGMPGSEVELAQNARTRNLEGRRKDEHSTVFVF